VSKLLSRKVLVPTAVVIVVLMIWAWLPVPHAVVPEISIPAEEVIHPFGIPITNTLLATWLTMILLIGVSWLITRKMTAVPGRWQSLLEMLIEGMYHLVEGAVERKWARRFFPIVMTIFIFLLVSNWLGLTPLYGGWGILEPPAEGEQGKAVEWLNDSKTVGLWVEPDEGQEEAAAGSHGEEEEQYKLAPMFRSAATDMNTTLALAIISVVLTQVFGVWALGAPYFGKFVAVKGVVQAFTKRGIGCAGRIGAFFMGLIDIFVGFVETISEFAKIISFSFRLFGNIFAGEVLLGVIGFLIPYLVSLPFYGLELFVGFVQALVFMMLTVAFFVTAMSHHSEEEH
jgi:F-type H+-transporting ATPase subunit a